MEHFCLMGRLNGWVNERLYRSTSALPDAAYRDDRKASFGSIPDIGCRADRRSGQATSPAQA